MMFFEYVLSFIFGQMPIVEYQHNTSLKYGYLIRYIEPALVKIESSGKSTVISHKGAMGLWQIYPITWKWMAPKVNVNVRDPFHPENNAIVGRAYLDYLLVKFNGNIFLAIAAYNAGETRIRQLIKHPDRDKTFIEIFPKLPKETQQYVMKVISQSIFSS